MDVINDQAVNETTVKKTHLKTEFFFMTHPQNKEKYPSKQRNRNGLGSFELGQQPVRLLNRLGGLSLGKDEAVYGRA